MRATLNVMPLRRSSMSGQLFAKVGPVAVGVIGASTAAISASTVIVAVGAAAALALAGYGIYRYLSSSSDSPPKEPVGEKAKLMYEWSRDGITVLEKLPFGELLKR